MFIDREPELAFLDSLLARQHPGPAQLVLLYGRRRVGKTALLRHWAAQSGLDYTHVAVEKEPAPLQRRKLHARLLDVPSQAGAHFASWSDLWAAVATFLGERRHILILDELPYAAESDPAVLTALQHAWDQHFQGSRVTLVLCGSHVHTMETLMAHGSPLFGRLTGQWELGPLPFGSLRTFLSGWSAAERVAAYAMVGGVPAYLEWLDPRHSLSDNIRNVMLRPGSMFVAEPSFLLYDEVRDPRTYLAILGAIGAGHHTLRDISNACLIGSSHLSAYLSTLQDLRLVERRLPVTIPPARRRLARQGRYHLRDAYFRFYFRFLAPHQDVAPFEPERVLRAVQDGLRAFVGQTAFEDLARQWITRQGQAALLPFRPEGVGSHWSRRVQIDVVGINWAERQILLGECKWGESMVGRQVIRDLLEHKTPLALRDLPDGGQGWQVHHAVFGRSGFTAAARADARTAGVLVVGLAELDDALSGEGG